MKVMTGKKALKEYRQIYIDKTLKYIVQPSEDYYLKIIEKDLDRLKSLEGKSKEIYKRNYELIEENNKLKKALDKACEKLNYTCPVEEELVEDLDCDYCVNNCKECWNKYFMKEVL